MKLVVHSASIEHKNMRVWRPEKPDNFSTFLVVAIGGKSRRSTSDFSIRIATPNGLAAVDSQTSIIAMRPLIVVKDFNYDDLWSWLTATVEACEADTWEGSVELLQRNFHWEYDYTNS
jgi:hypothetical protein